MTTLAVILTILLVVAAVELLLHLPKIPLAVWFRVTTTAALLLLVLGCAFQLLIGVCRGLEATEWDVLCILSALVVVSGGLGLAWICPRRSFSNDQHDEVAPPTGSAGVFRPH